MKDLRLYSNLPTTHEDFEIKLGYQDRGGRNSGNNNVWKDYDFGILAQSHTVVESDDASPQDRYLINGDVKDDFEKMDKTGMIFLELGQPNLRTESIIYAYENFKLNKNELL